ncbi:MAG: tetratricopeptide repeat protein [Ignavibacteriales bacterium]|nr:tetratricopeptide repeat protein [Ignavibacteriales bacterium]
MPKNCSRCNAPITQADKFCPECGAKIDWGAEGGADLYNFFAAKPSTTKGKTKSESHCEFCGHKNKKGATFCEGCGSILPTANVPDADEPAEFQLLFNQPNVEEQPTSAPLNVFPAPPPEEIPVKKEVPKPSVPKREMPKEESAPFRPAPVPEREAEPVKKKQHHVPKQHQKQKMELWKIYLIVAVVLLLLILLYAYFQEGKTATPVSNTVQSGPTLEHLQHLEEEVRANPNDATAQLNYANSLHDARSFHKAIEEYKKYLALVPDNPDARVDLGICYFENGNADAAITEMKKAIEYHPQHQKAYFNIGIVSLNSGNLEQAKEYFQKTASLSAATETGKRAQELLQTHFQ